MKKQDFFKKLEALKKYGEYENALMKRFFIKQICSEMTVEQKSKLFGLELSNGIINNINNDCIVIDNKSSDYFWILTNDIEVIINFIIKNNILE